MKYLLAIFVIANASLWADAVYDNMVLLEQRAERVSHLSEAAGQSCSSGYWAVENGEEELSDFAELVGQIKQRFEAVQQEINIAVGRAEEAGDLDRLLGQAVSSLAQYRQQASDLARQICSLADDDRIAPLLDDLLSLEGQAGEAYQEGQRVIAQVDSISSQLRATGAGVADLNAMIDQARTFESQVELAWQAARVHQENARADLKSIEKEAEGSEQLYDEVVRLIDRDPSAYPKGDRDRLTRAITQLRQERFRHAGCADEVESKVKSFKRRAGQLTDELDGIAEINRRSGKFLSQLSGTLERFKALRQKVERSRSTLQSSMAAIESAVLRGKGTRAAKDFTVEEKRDESNSRIDNCVGRAPSGRRC